MATTRKIKTGPALHRYGAAATPRKKKSASPRSQSKMPVAFPEINERFRNLRKEKGITQIELAEALGVTESAIKAIENDVVTPNLFIIMKMKNWSRRSYNYILEGV